LFGAYLTEPPLLPPLPPPRQTWVASPTLDQFQASMAPSPNPMMANNYPVPSMNAMSPPRVLLVPVMLPAGAPAAFPSLLPTPTSSVQPSLSSPVFSPVSPSSSTGEGLNAEPSPVAAKLPAAKAATEDLSGLLEEEEPLADPLAATEPSASTPRTRPASVSPTRASTARPSAHKLLGDNPNAPYEEKVGHAVGMLVQQGLEAAPELTQRLEDAGAVEKLAKIYENPGNVADDARRAYQTYKREHKPLFWLLNRTHAGEKIINHLPFEYQIPAQEVFSWLNAKPGASDSPPAIFSSKSSRLGS
jgi:hypothetical protein